MQLRCIKDRLIKVTNSEDLKEIIFIAIVDCILFLEKFEYKYQYTIRDEDTNEHGLKDFYFTFIELLKFPKIKEDRLESIVAKLVYFFKKVKEATERELERIIGSNVIIKKHMNGEIDSLAKRKNSLVMNKR